MRHESERRSLLDVEMDPLATAETQPPYPPEIMALVLRLPDEVLRLHEEAKAGRLAFLRDPRPLTEEACFAAEIAAADCNRGAPFLAHEVKRLRAAVEAAPHADCAAMKWYPDSARPRPACDCWKAAALKGSSP